MQFPRLFLPLFCLLMLPAVGGRADNATELPVQPNDLVILQRIASHEKLDQPPTINPKGWPPVDAAQRIRFSAEGGRHALTVGCNQDGRVTHLVGNGPLLCNEALGWIAGLTELKVIRIDHNTPKRGSARDLEAYDGSGFMALVDSKLEDVKIGHAFDDDGMRALAQVKSLKRIDIGHSRVTDAGIAALAGHAAIEEASFSPMGTPRITNETLKTLSTLPKLTTVGMNETFVTYQHGFEHLRKYQGQLKAVSLRQSLVLPADVEKLRADHPGLDVTSSTPGEVAEKGYRKNQLLKWASPEAIEYLQNTGN